jgi:hypothetical protein
MFNKNVKEIRGDYLTMRSYRWSLRLRRPTQVEYYVW